MNKAISMIRILLVGIGCIVLVAMYCIIQTQKSKVIYIYVQDPKIPSARRIQQRLKELDNPRYDPGKLDGIPGPNTMEGWNNYTKDQFAIKAVEER